MAKAGTRALAVLARAVKGFRRGALVALACVCIAAAATAPPALSQSATGPSSGSVPASAQSEEPVIAVADVRFTGNTVFSDEQLRALLPTTAGRAYTLAELEALPLAVTNHYRQAGYIASRAYLPEQRIEDGVLTIAVLEGRYGGVEVRNESRLSDKVVAAHLAGIEPGDVIWQPALYKSMTGLASLAGVEARSTLVPGAETGTADLLVTITDGDRFSGRLEVTNSGSRFTGVWRPTVVLGFSNPFGLGDELSLRAAYNGDRFGHASASYGVPLGVRPYRLQLSYSLVSYSLGEDFAALGATGRGEEVALSLETPLPSPASVPLRGRITLERSRRVDNLFSVSKERVIDAVTATVEGRHGGSWTGGRPLSGLFSVSLRAGKLDILDPVDRLIDEVTVKTNGDFQRINATYSLLTPVAGETTLYASAQAQWGFKNLDLTEKFSLGGATAVRAYPPGEASGDAGVLLNLELRRPLARFADGRLDGTFFVDAGAVRLHHTPSGPGANDRVLSGAGFGVSLTKGSFTLAAHVAWRLGSEAPKSDRDEGSRVWVQASWAF